MKYLLDNLPSFDIINKCSLGFCPSEINIDGLNDGIASFGTNSSLATRGLYNWAASVPKEIFNEYVAAYGNVNEGRTNIRPLL